jgi:hypothetical protein
LDGRQLSNLTFDGFKIIHASNIPVDLAGSRRAFGEQKPENVRKTLGSHLNIRFC